MGDWPGTAPGRSHGALVSVAPIHPVGALNEIAGSLCTNAAWPVQNLAIFVPVLVPDTVTVYQMGIWVGGTSDGNVDVGIYDELGSRLVSAGSTACGAINTLQLFNITDTLLTPGLYYLAMASSSNVTATFSRAAQTAVNLQASGVQQQASAIALPNPATFANPASDYVPLIAAFTTATTP